MKAATHNASELPPPYNALLVQHAIVDGLSDSAAAWRTGWASGHSRLRSSAQSLASG